MDPEDARKIVEGVEFIRSIRGSYEIKHLNLRLLQDKMQEDL